MALTFAKAVDLLLHHPKKAAKRIGESKYALPILFFLSFGESIIIPIPLEVLLIPYMLMHRDRIFKTATVVLAGCVLGAFTGYAVGHYFYESWGLWLFNALGVEQAHVEIARQWFQNNGFWAVVMIGVVPIPFQIAMVLAGASGYSLVLYTIATLIARGIRYYGLGWLVHAYGKKALDMWQQNKLKFSLIGGVVIAALWGLSFAVKQLLGI